MVKYVRLLGSNPNGSQSVRGVFYVGESGSVVYRQFGKDKPISKEAFDGTYSWIWNEDQTKKLVPEDGEEYLEALHFAFSGTYLRATKVMEDEWEDIP